LLAGKKSQDMKMPNNVTKSLKCKEFTSSDTRENTLKSIINIEFFDIPKIMS